MRAQGSRITYAVITAYQACCCGRTHRKKGAGEAGFRIGMAVERAKLLLALAHLTGKTTANERDRVQEALIKVHSSPPEPPIFQEAILAAWDFLIAVPSKLMHSSY